MKKFEYKIVRITDILEFDNKKVEDKLNRLGNDGWEMFFHTNHVFFFKRLKEPNPNAILYDSKVYDLFVTQSGLTVELVNRKTLCNDGNDYDLFVFRSVSGQEQITFTTDIEGVTYGFKNDSWNIVSKYR